MAFVDFAALKERVTIEQVVGWLGLAMKAANGQLRSPCPACEKGGDRALVVTPSKGAFYCFGGNTGGDLITLAAHIQGVSVKEAAAFLAERSGITGTVTNSSTSKSKPVPESERGNETKKLEPLTYLEHEHEAVIAVGFDPEVAKTLGVGYAGKGIMRGTVAIPVRDDLGNLLGYVGVTEARLPPAFTGNVIKFPKSA